MSENSSEQSVAAEEVVEETAEEPVGFVEDHKTRIRDARESSQGTKKEGTGSDDGTLGFFEYFEEGLKEGNRWMFDNAFQRIYRHVIARSGIVRFNHETFPKRARAIGLPSDGELFLPISLLKNFMGMEYDHDVAVRHILNAARGGEAALQMLTWWGPPGTAKSRKVESMRDLLTGAPIFHLKDCPVRDSPLLLLPLGKRAAYAEEFGIPIPKNKDICLVCRYNLREKYGGRWEDFKVALDTVSKRRNIGSAAVAPFDPNTMGSEVLIGDEMFWLPPGTPMEKRLRFSVGAFAQGQGGIVEFYEILKAPKEARNLLLTATQDQVFPTPNYYEWVSSDFLVVAHANIPEVSRWRAQHDNDAFFDRMNSILSPYTVSPSIEERIYAAMQSRVTAARGSDEDEILAKIEEEVDGIEDGMMVPDPERLIDDNEIRLHRAPHVRVFAAKFATASRLDIEDKKEGSEDLSGTELLQRVEMLDCGSAEDIRDHLSKHPTEGFDGLSSRFMIKAFEDADAGALLRWGVAGEDTSATLSRNHACTGLDDIRWALERRIQHEIILSRCAEDRQDTDYWNRLFKRIGGDKGSFTRAFLKRIRRQIFETFWHDGIISTIVGDDVVQGAIRDIISRYRTSLYQLAEQEWPNEFPDGVDGDLLRAVEWRMGVSGENAQHADFRKRFYERTVSGRVDAERVTQEEPHNSEELLSDLHKAAERYVLFTHRDEWLRKIADRIAISSVQSPAWLKKNGILPDESQYCARCLTWTLRLVTSPFLQDEEPDEEPESES